MLNSVIETPHFSQEINGLLADAELKALVNHLAAYPLDGDLVQGTGGVRKIRWARAGRGKSSGMRVIYYYHSERLPLFLLTAFAKGDAANLSKAQRNELAALVTLLKGLVHDEPH
jgi:hypothetical protein